MFHKFRSRRFFSSQVKKKPVSLDSFKWPKDKLFLNHTVKDSFFDGKTCAIVGNSGHLMDQNYAKDIDSHDVVIRFSLAPVIGFEDRVGSKTSLRMINNKVFSGIKDPMSKHEKDDQLLEFMHDNIIVATWDSRYFESSIFKFSHAKQLLFLNQDFKKNICDRYFYRSSTTGFIGIILALNYFNHVSLYGFNFYQGDWKKRHYFESCKKYVSEHSHGEEQYVVNALAEQGLITICGQ